MSEQTMIREHGSAGRLDPFWRPILEMLASQPSITSMEPETVRANGRARVNPYAPPKREMAAVEDRVIPGKGGDIPIRVYRPRTAADKTTGAALYFHGGGFVIGSVEGSDLVTRTLADEAGLPVISVDYRLAPEAKFPAAVEDAEAAYLWAVENCRELAIDGTRIAVAGDSAGANLATVTCLRMKETNGPMPAAQALVYPVTDIMAKESPSKVEFAEGYLLTRAMIDWFADHYLRDPGDAAHPHVAPIQAGDLSGLPPALVITAGFDPLRDEGKAYADRLLAEGCEVTYACYTGMIHAFLGYAGGTPDGMRAIEEVARMLEKHCVRAG